MINTQLIQDEDNESRYKITSIIGLADDIGVENLSAAGMIAGETSQAYDEIVTISLVSGRAIGIGTYLVRLSQRVVQVDNSSLILTGYTALNKLLGREVYTSNTQLGGIQIMHNNGVSHATAHNDVEGVKKILKWLSYVPKKKGGALPILEDFSDPIDRLVEYRPRQNQVYDPRWLIGKLKYFLCLDFRKKDCYFSNSTIVYKISCLTFCLFFRLRFWPHLSGYFDIENSKEKKNPENIETGYFRVSSD